MKITHDCNGTACTCQSLPKTKMKSNKEYPERIWATERIDTNGIHALDYQNYPEDIEYVRVDIIQQVKQDTLDAVREYLRNSYRKWDDVPIETVNDLTLERIYEKDK